MLIAILLILAVSCGGFALTYLIERDEPMLWRVCAGTVIGQCIFGTALFVLSFGFGLGLFSIALAIAISLVPIVVLRNGVRRKTFDYDWAKAKGKLQGAKLRKVLPFLYYFGFLVFFVLFFDRAMITTAEGIFTGGSNNLGDLPFHLGIIYSFADGANFPPQNPSFAGVKFSYPFIADLAAAALLRSGAWIREAMLVQNVSWAFALLVILERFVFRWIGDRLASRLAPFLLFLSGGLGFLWFFSDYAAQSKNIFHLLMDIGKDYTISQEFRWGNSLITLFLTQRSLLLGMPLTLLILNELRKIFTTEDTERLEIISKIDRIPVAALVLGLIAGMLPLIHLHSLFVLFVVTAFLFIMRPEKRRHWTAFGVGVFVIAVPELIWSMAGGATRVGEFFGVYFGWESAQSNIFYAWLKNAGFVIPMIAVGLYLFNRERKREISQHQSEKRHPGKTKKHARETENYVHDHSMNLLLFYVPFAFLFVLANIVKLAPWEWDNIKVLIYWFIGSIPFIAFAISWLWKKTGGMRVAAVLAIFVLTASGALDVWRTLSRQHNYRVFDQDAINVAERLRTTTPADALFLNAPTYNSAVVLSGRLSLIRYPGHLSSHGINYSARETEVKQMYRGGPIAQSLFEKYGIDYVLISPEERSTLTPNESFFSRFPVAAESGQYKVYDVRARN